MIESFSNYNFKKTEMHKTKSMSRAAVQGYRGEFHIQVLRGLQSERPPAKENLHLSVAILQYLYLLQNM